MKKSVVVGVQNEVVEVVVPENNDDGDLLASGGSNGRPVRERGDFLDI